MAVRDGLTTDGLNLDELPQEYQGVTCYFCHSIDEVTGNHNAAVSLADDLVLRGGLQNPLRNNAHRSEYAEIMDRNRLPSADVCGSCHDVVTPAGVHLERSYLEWQNSLYAEDIRGLRQTCGNCHMDGSDGIAADYPGVQSRRIHDHSMPAVDVALTPFPNQETQRARVQQLLDTTVNTELNICETETGFDIRLMLENVSAGHSWPSGAAHDRRTWVEVIATLGETVLFKTGIVPSNQALSAIDDPHLLQFGDRLFGEDGTEVHHFWEARDYEANVLTSLASLYTIDLNYVDGHYYKTWSVQASMPDMVTVNVYLRPIGLDILDDLVSSGDLDPAHREAMPTFKLAGPAKLWTSESTNSCETAN
jgi:hypothetical protein